MQTYNTSTIKEILAKGSYLSHKDLERAEVAARASHTDFLEYLFGQKLLTKDLWGQAIAESLSLPYFDLNSFQPTREQVLTIPETLARKYRVVLFKQTKADTRIASDEPEQKGLSDTLKGLFPKKLVIGYSLSEDIDEALTQYRAQIGKRFAEHVHDGKEAPEIITELCDEAISIRASDIHFEPQESHIVIRFRIDGVLHEIDTISKEQYEMVLNRVKVQSHLRTDEHFAAQDGSMRHERSGGTVHIRVSIIPTLDGEKIVMRILAEYVRGFTFDDLGLSVKHQAILLETTDKPFGMILVVGPTGSGKTTTLYSLLKRLNQPGINITTIEDPVEYKIPGVNHIQVNQQTNLSFAKGLRSIVRQDPDIIFLGEVRDKESAEIGVNAALTGHLLLSTFHANDATTAIPRLLDMGIERFLLASTLELVIAQVLVRRICETCRMSTTDARMAVKKMLKTNRLYRGKGCATCAGTGYKGRVALYEFIKNTPELQEVIIKNPSRKELWAQARSQGARSLYEDGLDKVKNGVTTLEEVLRVAAPPSKIV